MSTPHWTTLVQTGAAAIQTTAVIVGLCFALSELSEARKAYQAATVSDIHERAAGLQWRVIEDVDLAPLLLGDSLTAEAKQAVAAAMVINEFATMFDLWKLGGIPDAAWESLENDIRATMSSEIFSTRWKQLRLQHGRDFRRYIDDVLELRGEEP